MITVNVSASRNYDVCIGSGLLSHLGQEAARVCRPGKIAVISDSTVWPIYGQTVLKSLSDAAFHPISYVFPAGESSKNGETYLDLLNFLARNQLTRSDCLVALGGGVVGDLTGFAAATYLRGVSYIQVPTTLLAAVDSSVGGKTAIDLPAGKNLAGAFCQPAMVLCDIDTLNTLPKQIFQDGCAEVIKYGILYDEELFSHLEEKGLDFNRESVIAQCVKLKRDVVKEDEFDTGARQKLNLGHTVGHAIEALSHFEISHGQAVAAGTAIVTKASSAAGMCSSQTANRILSVLSKFGLPTATDYCSADLYGAARSDKKRSGQTVNFIIPNAIGSCCIYPLKTEKIQDFIKAGL